MEFDIEDIIVYIRDHVSDEVSARFSDDDLVSVVDAMVDYDFEHGLLDLSADIDDDNPVDMAGIVSYVSRRVNPKGTVRFSHDDLCDIVKVELDYENSIFD